MPIIDMLGSFLPDDHPIAIAITIAVAVWCAGSHAWRLFVAWRVRRARAARYPSSRERRLLLQTLRSLQPEFLSMAEWWLRVVRGPLWESLVQEDAEEVVLGATAATEVIFQQILTQDPTMFDSRSDDQVRHAVRDLLGQQLHAKLGDLMGWSTASRRPAPR